jgi:signal transduction histidine kinase
VYAGREGSIWSGFSAGLFVNRGEGWKPYSDFRFVRGIYEDRQGVLWVGTRSSGLMRIERDIATEVKLASGESIVRAAAFSEAPDGSLYIGTRNDGLYRFANGTVTNLTVAQGLPSNEVRDVHVDHEGHVWVGMRGRGLALLNGDRWFNPEALVAAVANHVSAIHADAHGRLWIGSSAGVLWISRRELIAAAKEGSPIPPVHAITGNNDALDVPVWSGSQPVVWPGSDGQLWFATRRGAIAIDPRNVESNPVPPPVHVERVLVDRQEVKHTGGVTLPAGVRTLAVEYTGLSFVEPSRVRFKYRLDGYDPDWIEADTHRTAFYTRLPPGNYTFRVIASNNDGVWNTTGRELAVVQLPYFYQTYWFRALLGAAAFGCVLGIYRWSHRRLRDRVERLERERAMDNERRRIAQDLHDDLGANLTEIGLFAESSIATTPEETRREMDFVAQRARSLVRSLDAVVWAVNPANDSLDELSTYMGEFYQDLFACSAIGARLDMAPEIPRYPLTAEERSNLFLAAKEAMNNILKHSGATEAWLRIGMSGEEFHVSIEDNGHGFDPNNPRSRKGNGLANMKSRLQKSGGTIEIASEPGKGTSVRIAIRFNGRTRLPKT